MALERLDHEDLNRGFVFVFGPDDRDDACPVRSVVVDDVAFTDVLGVAGLAEVLAGLVTELVAERHSQEATGGS